MTPTLETLERLRASRDHADRYFAEPLDLAQLAAVAAISKHHFHRLFTATYGATPAAYVSRRRIERAQDLLRSGERSVTDVCVEVGFASLGSFSARFREIVGETPSDFRRRWAGAPPRIPSCHTFMRGLAERRPATAADERPVA